MTTTATAFAEWWPATREEYDADTEYLRSSHLKDFSDCPTIYRARHITGTMPDKSQSREMVIGTCLHAIALEGEVPWMVATECQAVKKDGKQCGNSVSATGSVLFDNDEQIFVCGVHRRGRNVSEVTDALTPEEDERVRGMATAIENNAEAQELLAERLHERAARDVDTETGVKRKALIDVIRYRDNQIWLGDIKTTGEFNSESIWRKMDQNEWLLSLSHYESIVQNVARVKKGKEIPPFAWVFLIVESVPPFRVKLWDVDHDVAHGARQEYRELLAEFGEAQRSGVYRQRELSTAPPQWFFYRHGYAQEGSK